jgi:UDP-arabinose 4-epimerase
LREQHDFLNLVDDLRNCSTGSSVKEFVEACKAATGVDIIVKYLDRRPGDYAEVYSDPSKIQKELNWVATHTDLKDSLAVAWKWHTLHRNGYNAESGG